MNCVDNSQLAPLSLYHYWSALIDNSQPKTFLTCLFFYYKNKSAPKIINGKYSSHVLYFYVKKSNFT